RGRDGGRRAGRVVRARPAARARDRRLDLRGHRDLRVLLRPQRPPGRCAHPDERSRTKGNPMRMRRIAPLATVVAGALVLTACSGGGDGGGGTDGGDGGGGEALESLTIMAPYFAEVPPEDDDPVDQGLSELAGVDIDVQWVPNSSYGERVK